MAHNEADTRAKLFDPAVHKCGWTEDQIRREETAGTVEIINGKAGRRSRGKNYPQVSEAEYERSAWIWSAL